MFEIRCTIWFISQENEGLLAVKLTRCIRVVVVSRLLDIYLHRVYYLNELCVLLNNRRMNERVETTRNCYITENLNAQDVGRGRRPVRPALILTRDIVAHRETCIQVHPLVPSTLLMNEIWWLNFKSHSL